VPVTDLANVADNRPVVMALATAIHSSTMAAIRKIVKAEETAHRRTGRCERLSPLAGEEDPPDDTGVS
jgi:hypothetical protein